MPDAPPQTIQLKNPRVIELVVAEHTRGAGRSVTEAAENLIAEAVEQRRVARAGNDPDRPARRAKQVA